MELLKIDGTVFDHHCCIGVIPLDTNLNIACVRGSPMVSLVSKICAIYTNLMEPLIKKLVQMVKNSNTIGTNDTNVTNQWYHWENPEHMHNLTHI